MVSDLTSMEIANSSLLDEATAAAEAMTMCSALARGKKTKFLVSVSPLSCYGVFLIRLLAKVPQFTTRRNVISWAAS